MILTEFFIGLTVGLGIFFYFHILGFKNGIMVIVHIFLMFLLGLLAIAVGKLIMSLF